MLLVLLCSYSCVYASSNDYDFFDEEAYFALYDGHTPKKRPVYDPLEKGNRRLYQVSLAVDNLIVYSTLSIYRYVFPRSFRSRLNTVLRNISEPSNAVNALLQGNRKGFAKSLWRFGFNSTVGLFGLFDVAGGIDVKHESYSFTDVMLSGGLRRGPYVVLPFVGVYPLYVMMGDIASATLNPLSYFSWSIKGAIYGFSFLNICDMYCDMKRKIQSNSLDSYNQMRDIYEQKLYRKR